MKKLSLTLSVILGLVVFSGCAKTTMTSRSGGATGPSSRPVSSGLKSPAQVAPCCKALAEGKISLDRCMENPQCIANNRTCCMNAF